MTPASRWSQNFLVDPAVARRIVAAFAPCPGDHVLEVGPGHGVLTTQVAGRVARLIAVEIDRALAADLDRSQPGLELHAVDILTLPLAGLRHGPRLRILSNLPYAISSPFLVKLVAEAESIEDAQLLLQLEFADRLAARPGTKAYGSLTVLVQTSFEVIPAFQVPAAAFRPRPTVRSRLVRLIPRRQTAPDAIGRERLTRLLRAAFSARRKMLAKALSAGLARDRDQVVTELERAGIDPTCRAERLSPETWLELAAGPLAD